jgi:hypothetical protein
LAEGLQLLIDQGFHFVRLDDFAINVVQQGK